MTSIVNKVRALVGRVKAFAEAKRGNVAMIFALTIVPILLAGGAGIDLSRALVTRNALQSALDSAALAVATAPQNSSTAEKQIIAQNYFNANYHMDVSFGAPAPVTVTMTDNTAVVSTSNNMPTTLMRIAMIDHVALASSSTVTWGQTKLWVGLALDNTGSMDDPGNGGSGSKIVALKTATHQLLSVLEAAAAHPGDVRVSLVPFSKDVNAGASNYTQDWVDWTDWDSKNGACSLSGSGTSTKSGCEAKTSGSCSNSSYTSQSNCTSNGTCTISGNTTKNSCEAATTGTCSIAGYTSSSQCTTHGACSISGYTSQSTCIAATVGSFCSISGYNSKSTCEAAIVGQSCSISGYSSKSTCEAAIVGASCSISGYNTQSSCTAASTGGSCSHSQDTTQSVCIATKRCSKPAYTLQTTCQANGGTWAKGVWSGQTFGVWNPGTHGVWNPGTHGVWTVGTYGVWTWGVWSISAYGVWSPYVWTTVNGVWTVYNHNTWNGCIADRGDTTGPSDPAYDSKNTNPNGSAASKFPAEQYSSCPKQMLGLSYDWSAMSTKVDDMTPAGNTNQVIGLAWAWQTLTDGSPMEPGTLPPNTSKFVILMSDGLNTQNRWSSTQATIDARLAEACSNAKADGVVIYSVQVDTANDGESAVMKNCATGGALGGKYFHLTTAGATITAFNQIGQQITNMRVSS